MLPISERDRRWQALRSAAENRGWDAIIVVGHGDCVTRGRIAYTTRFHLLERVMFFVLPLREEPVVVTEPLVIFAGTDWVEQTRLSWEPGAEVGRVLGDLGLADGTVGVVGMRDSLSLGNHADLMAVAPNLTLVDADEAFQAILEIKSDVEIAELRQASADLRDAGQCIQDALRPGVSERELLAHGHALLRELGALDVVLAISRPPFQGYGGPTGFHYPDESRIGSDDVVVVSFDVSNEAGYWCEMRRVYSFRGPTDAEERFWSFRKDTFTEAIGAIRPGRSSAEIGDALDSLYQHHGYDRAGIESPSVHGIGIQIHEEPVLPGWDTVMQPNMVICLHPFVRLSQEQAAAVGDLSIADSVLVTESGAERLTDQEDQWHLVG
jgi:Xaa-Pro dipeptidase